MTISDTSPIPITFLTPKLDALVRQRMEGLLAYLVTTNSVTAFFNESSLLSDFRIHLAQETYPLSKIARAGDDTNSVPPPLPINIFSSHVPLSTYNDYQPFISRFFESPRSKTKVSNLLAPGIPGFVVTSSGTAGGAAKYFLKYKHPLFTSSSAVEGMTLCNPTPKCGGSHCVIFNLRYSELLDVLDGDTEQVIKRVPLCLGSAVAFRSYMGWNIENDKALMATKAPNTTSPLAISFIHSYRTSLIMHALFALGDRSLEMINTLFCTIFFDFVRLLEQYWDTLLQAIEDGTVPYFEGAEGVKHYLQAQLHPNPARAAELRALGVDTASAGWIKRVWPNLDRVMGNASGTFSRVIPQVQHYLGPSVQLQSIGLTSSETWIAQIYDPRRDSNLYKMSTDDIFEYLDVTLPEVGESLKQSWEVEVGRFYEIVLTTRDGLWRYRLGDVVEVAGFDPTDGQPLIRYSERRNVMMRASTEFVTEKELQDAIQSAEDILGPVMEFTVVVDERAVPCVYGFLVELQTLPEPIPKAGPTRIHNFLLTSNETYTQCYSRNVLGIPTIRILAPGTFGLYREWKTQSSAAGSGQIKVPTVTYNSDVRAWLLKHVTHEA